MKKSLLSILIIIFTIQTILVNAIPPTPIIRETAEAPSSFTLSVSINIENKDVPYSIADIGLVTSDPIGIDCGNSCKFSFAFGTVKLNATALSKNWVFDNWSGDCRGTTQQVNITINSNPHNRGFLCTANFKPIPGQIFNQEVLSTNYRNPPSPSSEFDINNQSWGNNICRGDEWPTLNSALYEWMPIFGDEYDSDLIGLSGTAINPTFSGGDVWFTHPFGFDYEFYIAPDSNYTSLLSSHSGNNIGDDPEFKDALNHARDMKISVPGVIGVETDQGLVPDFYRSRDGDRVAVFGRWIADCGHKPFHSEIHPPLLLVSASVSAGGDSTVSKVVSRPYLVSQRFTVDNKPFLYHMLNEASLSLGLNNGFSFLGAIGITRFCDNILGFIPWPTPAPCTTRIEAHPQIMPKPFSGPHIISYVVRPPTQRISPNDRLIANFHFTVRKGVAVQVIGPDNSLTGTDAVGVLIAMNDIGYISPQLPQQNNGLGANFVFANEGPDCSVTKSDSEKYVGSILPIIETASPVVSLGFDFILDRGIKTDCYDPPKASSVYDSDNISIPATELRVNTPFSEDNNQAFPIYGWLELKWERHPNIPSARITPPPSR